MAPNYQDLKGSSTGTDHLTILDPARLVTSTHWSLIFRLDDTNCIHTYIISKGSSHEMSKDSMVGATSGGE